MSNPYFQVPTREELEKNPELGFIFITQLPLAKAIEIHGEQHIRNIQAELVRDGEQFDENRFFLTFDQITCDYTLAYRRLSGKTPLFYVSQKRKMERFAAEMALAVLGAPGVSPSSLNPTPATKDLPPALSALLGGLSDLADHDCGDPSCPAHDVTRKPKKGSGQSYN